MPTDPTAVAQEFFDHLAASWNNADGPGFGARFADETDFIDIRGDHHHGDRVLVGAGHQAILDTIYAGSTVTYSVDTARMLPGGVLLALANATLEAPAGPLRGTNRSVITAVLLDNDGSWECTAFHNTLVTAAPGG